MTETPLAFDNVNVDAANGHVPGKQGIYYVVRSLHLLIYQFTIRLPRAPSESHACHGSVRGTSDDQARGHQCLAMAVDEYLEASEEGDHREAEHSLASSLL